MIIKINEMKILFFVIICFLSLNLFGIPLPKNNEVNFDVIRKNKVIGSVKTTFKEENNKLTIRTVVDIDVKILFIPAYKFFQDTTEIWVDNEFVEIDGYTDFEDEREYFIKGSDEGENFVASGMDGQLLLSKDIIPLNYWNKKILEQKEVFDTQKGIVRKISVQKLENETIEVNKLKIETEKYLMNASKNPKDLGPFPEYTLWYRGDELIQFEFTNWKDSKKVLTVRNDLK
ncbi:MAG: hypothetical protein CMP16_02175 [Rickettsiales bacterium]|nr:hypothetical protein [Rickettsiales bacterium]|tara:strand:+ start:1414 stop:2106 length:693 start_codon:yes stop_codon:yes gene_type:complete